MGLVLKWVGREDFLRALRSLPEDLKREAAVVVEAAAEDAKRQAYFAYPQKTGNLRRGLRVTYNAGRRFSREAILKSAAPHAHLYEFGTHGKERFTDSGVSRGVMPEAPEQHAFIPIAIRVRRRMTKALIEIVRKAGFVVDE